MTFVKMLDDARPASRSDGVPFTIARMQEAPDIPGAPTGLVWVTRTSVALATGVPTPGSSGGVTPLGLDADPAAPVARDVTTSAATIETGGWYRVLWEDAAGGQDPGDAVQDILNDPSLTTDLGKFRLELGDQHAALFTDAEADYYIARHPTNLLLAVADACDALAARFANQVDFSANEAKKFSLSQKSKQYLAMAERFRARANTEGNSDGSGGGVPLGSFPGPHDWQRDLAGLPATIDPSTTWPL